ncbi:MAG: S8 family serine peptidase [Bacteroidales bacterium]|jgi:hypothetical protein|nr:S8 family serine peptidase [Bacteroidales bacterium]
MKYKFLIFILCVGALFTSYAQTFHPDFRDGIIYVKFVDDFPLDKISPKIISPSDEKTEIKPATIINIKQFPFLDETFKRYNVTSIHRPFTIFENPRLLRIIQIEFSKIELIDALIEELQTFKEIEYAEKVPIDRINWIPNDPLYGTVDGGNLKWHLDMIKADSAWDIQKGSASIKVAIVDNFIWGNHPDLQIDSLNLCKVSYNSISGYEYTLGNTAASPPSTITQSSNSTAYSASHGTHCAGLVGAINNNNTGIASIGGGVTLMGIRSAIDNGSLYYTYEGVQWAAENGADVISMSFGSSYYSESIEIFLQTLYDAGIVLVAAAGNEGDEGNPIHYPSEFASVISVASVNGDKKLSYFSQYGDRADIAAPGGFIQSNTVYPNVLSTTYCKAYILKSKYTSLLNTYYDGMQGTSMACPVLAGLCGLMLSKDSTLSPAEIKYRLQKTALPLHPASSTTINGNGYINAFAALTFQELALRDTLYLSSALNAFDTIKIKSTDNWQMTNIPSWLSVSDTIGSKGISTITITTNAANTSGSNKEALLTVQMGSITQTLLIIQLDYELFLHNSPNYVLFSGAKDNSDTIIIQANTEWEIINPCAWIGINKTSGYGNDTIVINTKSINSWGYHRFCTLLIHGINFIQDSVIIEQKIPDFIKWETASIYIGPALGNTQSVAVLSNVNWNITGGDDWINADISSGSDTMTVTFSVLSDNTTGEEKTTSYVVSNGSISKTLYVLQKADLSVTNVEESEKILLYPNPASEFIFVETEGITIENIKITDAIGNIVLPIGDISGGKINLFDLSNGIYFIKITTNTHQTIYKKFVKQK